MRYTKISAAGKYVTSGTVPDVTLPGIADAVHAVDVATVTVVYRDGSSTMYVRESAPEQQPEGVTP